MHDILTTGEARQRAPKQAAGSQPAAADRATRAYSPASVSCNTCKIYAVYVYNIYVAIVSGSLLLIQSIKHARTKVVSACHASHIQMGVVTKQAHVSSVTFSIHMLKGS